METFGRYYLTNNIKALRQYKEKAEDAMAQLDEKQLFYAPDSESNSVAVVAKHIAGNILSRWTDFLTSDGEKPWRNRDAEFEAGDLKTKEDLLKIWEQGWNCMFNALNQLTPEDLFKKVRIRGEEYTAAEALERQKAHYFSHIGQIVYVAKMIQGKAWKSQSIPRGESKEFNRKMFGKK